MEATGMVWGRATSTAHTLQADGVVLARLVRTGETTTRAEAWDAVYDVAKVGFVRPRVVVRPEGSLRDVAAFVEQNTGEAEITFADGTRYAFDRLSLADGECVVRDAKGRRVLLMRRRLTDDGPGAALRVDRRLDRRTATVLAMISWQVLLLDLDDPRRPVSMYNGPERRRRPRAEL